MSSKNPAQCLGQSYDLFEHRSVITFFPECHVLISHSLFRLLAIFKIDAVGITANHVA